MELDIQLFSGEMSPEMLDLMRQADPSDKHLDKYLHQSQILCSYFQNTLVGVIALTLPSANMAEIRNISVLEQYQGKGIGKALIQASQHLCYELGASTLEVGTGNSSLDQLAFYQKQGFRLFSIEPDFFKDYPAPILENGIVCQDLIKLRLPLMKRQYHS